MVSNEIIKEIEREKKCKISFTSNSLLQLLEEFCKVSEIQDIHKYLDDVLNIILSSRSSAYPIIKYPNNLIKAARIKPGKREYKYEKVKVGGKIRLVRSKQTNEVIDDRYFIELAQSYNYNVKYIEPVASSFNKQQPTFEEIPKTYNENYIEKKPTKTIWYILGSSVLMGIIAPSIHRIGIIFGWIIVWMAIFQDRLIKKKAETRKIPYSEEERKKLLKEAERQYSFEKWKYDIDKKNYFEQWPVIIKTVNSALPTILKRLWKDSSKGKFSLQRVDNPRRGISEDAFFAVLMAKIPKYVRIDMSAFGYYPDITLNINNTHFVDIEIDEPYTLDNNYIKEIHYIDCGDTKRDEVFTNNNWFVLRFAESQIKQNPEECVQIIVNLVNFIISGESSPLVELYKLSKKIETKLWSKEEARLMAITQSRGIKTFKNHTHSETQSTSYNNDDAVDEDFDSLPF